MNDLGNLLTPTAASSKKGPTKPFRAHSLTMSRSRSIPANEQPQHVNMKPKPSDRLDLDRHITQGRFTKWTGESSQPVFKNNSWWKGEGAGSEGTIQEQRRRRNNRGALLDDDEANAAGKSRRNNLKGEAAERAQQEEELMKSRDRFGRSFKDSVRGGKIDSEKKPNLAEATVRKYQILSDEEKKKLKEDPPPVKDFGIRCQYIQGCTDVIHRDWKSRYSIPPQAKDADAVTSLLEETGMMMMNTDGNNHSSNNNSKKQQQTYRVLPPLKEVEKVYFMSRGQASKAGKRFSSPFAKNERSAREGYINNDNALGRTTPVGDRESASNAAKLSCLALATADARRTVEDDEANNQAGHRASFTSSRSVVIELPQENNNNNNNSGGNDASSKKKEREQQKFRPMDSSRVRLNSLQRPDRMSSSRGGMNFSSIPGSVLTIMQPAGL